MPINRGTDLRDQLHDFCVADIALVFAGYIDNAAAVDDVVRRIENACVREALTILVRFELVVRAARDDRACATGEWICSVNTAPSAHGATTSTSQNRMSSSGRCRRPELVDDSLDLGVIKIGDRQCRAGLAEQPAEVIPDIANALHGHACAAPARRGRA